MIWLTLFACGDTTPAEPAHPEPMEKAEAHDDAAHAEDGKKEDGNEEAVAATERVNLNTASEEVLKGLPDMTPKMVHEFEEYRPYKSIQQFRKEIGKYVSAEQVAAWEPHVYVPIAFDACDAPTLAQLPGLDEAGAKELMEKRPFGDRDAFLKALEEKVGAEQAKAGAKLVE